MRNLLTGCVVDFHKPDARWETEEVTEALGNQALMRYAPWLLEEVPALRAEYHALTGRHWYGGEQEAEGNA